MFCEIYVQSVAHITTIHDLFFYLFFLKWSSIPDSPSPILDPDFPVNLEVLHFTIILFFFSTTEVITCSKVINAFKR